MSRSTRTLFLAGLAAVATVGLTACGSLDGSAHAAADGTTSTSATTSAAAAAAAAAATTATTDPGATSGPAAAPAGQGQRSTSGGTNGGGTNTSGTNTGGGTNNAGTNAGGGTNTGGGTPGPKIVSLKVTRQPHCPVKGTPDAPFSSPGNGVTIAWSVTGAKGAAVSMDSPGQYGSFGSDYPATGSLELPFECEGSGPTTTHTYTVFAAGSPGVSRTISASARTNP